MNNNIANNDNQAGIYKITNLVNGKIYIGQTVDVNSRKRSHLSDLRNEKHQNSYLQNAWMKYKECNFSFEVTHLCDKTELDKWEIYYINKFNSTDRRLGYNLRGGGKGKWSVSKESIGKMRKTKISRKLHRGEKNANALFSNATAEKIIHDLLNDYTGEYVVDKYNIPMSSIRGIVQNRTYIDVLPEIREKLRNKRENAYTNKKQKAVKMYSEGFSQSKISKMLNMSRNTIRNELLKSGMDTKIHKNQMEFKSKHPRAKPVVQLTIDDELVNKFDYIKEAGRITGINERDISTVCRKEERKTAGGYKWMYLEEYESMKALQ